MKAVKVLNKARLTVGDPRSSERDTDHGQGASFMSSGALPVRSEGPPDGLVTRQGEGGGSARGELAQGYVTVRNCEGNTQVGKEQGQNEDRAPEMSVYLR